MAEEFVEDLALVERWLDGDLEWEELPENVQSAIDEAMVELMPMVKDVTSNDVHVDTIMGNAKPKKKKPKAEKQDIELVHKADDEHRFTLGPWYIPNRYDAHGEWTDADELQKSLWDYVRSGDRDIRLQHNRDIVAGEWLEALSFPVPVTIPMNKGLESKEVTYPAGTVFLGVQWKPWAWDMVKAGKITGFSIGGSAARLEMEMPIEMGKARFSSRSEAGRYAANVRWQNEGGEARDSFQNRVAQAVMRYRAGLRSVAESTLALGRLTPKSRLGRAIIEMLQEDGTYSRRTEIRPSSFPGRVGGYERVTYVKSLDVIKVRDVGGCDWSLKLIEDQPDTFAMMTNIDGGSAVIKSNDDQIWAVGDDRISGLSEEEIIEIFFDAITKARFSSRSEAGRYAANIRWQGQGVNSPTSISPTGNQYDSRGFPAGGPLPLPVTTQGDRALAYYGSLKGHLDFDAAAREFLDDPRSVGIPPEKIAENIPFDILKKHLTPERALLWEKIINDALEGKVARTGIVPTYTFMGGGPAAGKTTALQSGLVTVPTRDSQGKLLTGADASTSIELGADLTKEAFAEYQGLIAGEGSEKARKEAAALFHEESSILTKQINDRAIAMKLDIVLDGTGDSNLQGLTKKVEKVRKAGYTVNGIYATIPSNMAWQRAQQRGLPAGTPINPEGTRFAEGRYMHKKTVIGIHADVSRVFPEAIDAGIFDRVTLFDTRTFGSPVLILESNQGQTRIYNQGLYEEFKAKAYQ
jgi:hypothetical protein